MIKTQKIRAGRAGEGSVNGENGEKRRNGWGEATSCRIMCPCSPLSLTCILVIKGHCAANRKVAVSIPDDVV
jgi:hypothetical protein